MGKSQQPPVSETQPSEVRAPSPTIHEAELGSGASGAVLYGAEIDIAGAVARRQAGKNVVVRGNDTDANRRLARTIEETVGSARRGEPHERAGAGALPHFQPSKRPPEGHTFYETSRRKARRKK
jgi:hypothetical protein